MKNVIFVTVVLLAMLAGLLWLASEGSIAAVGVLFSVWTLLCVIVGAGIVAYVNRSRAKEEQASFAANAKENLQMMQALQNVQNKQNQSLMQQLNQAAKLPSPSNQNGNGFVIDDGIFEELE